MMTATPNLFCLKQIPYAHHFFTFEKKFNFCSENWLHLFNSLWLTEVGKGGFKIAQKCAYVIYEWYLVEATYHHGLRPRPRNLDRD